MTNSDDAAPPSSNHRTRLLPKVPTKLFGGNLLHFLVESLVCLSSVSGVRLNSERGTSLCFGIDFNAATQLIERFVLVNNPQQSRGKMVSLKC